MVNYLRAEFYKVFRRRYVWVTLAIVLALEGLLVSGFVFLNAHGGYEDFCTGAFVVVMTLSLGFYATLLTGDMVFAGQYKHSTLKNEVSFGLSRARIYLGKLIAQTVLSVLFCAVMLIFYLGLCWLLLYHDPETDAAILRQLGYCLAVSFPLWIGVQAMVCAMLFLIRSEVGGAFAAVGVIAVLPYGLYFVSVIVGGVHGSPLGDALMAAYRHMPAIMVSQARDLVGDWAWCGRAWIVGAVWCAAFTALGLLGFRKKEIQ